jgi:hypothetical protein
MGGYKNYYDKVTVYFNTISAAAQNYDNHQFVQLRGTGIVHSRGSVLCYDDTNASRAGIVGINERLCGHKIAIIGLGGTGGYLLDYLAKTEVAEIHLYDEDVFNTHNAFRAPGAPSIEQLNHQPYKVDYFSEIYGRMHTGVIPHRLRITKDNISELDDKDMVFISSAKDCAKTIPLVAGYTRTDAAGKIKDICYQDNAKEGVRELGTEVTTEMLEAAEVNKIVQKIGAWLPDILVTYPRASATVAVLPFILKYGFGLEKTRKTQPKADATPSVEVQQKTEVQSLRKEVK